MSDTISTSVWVVRRREDKNTAYKTVLETANFETARAEFRALCYRDMSCDPLVETRDIEKRIPNPSKAGWTNQWDFQHRYNEGAKTRLYKSDRKL